MKTLIAIPCMDTTPTLFTQALLRLEKGPDVAVCMKPNSLVYDSRNLMSLSAIEQGFDYVFWLDSDMIVPPDTLRRLLKTAETFPADMVTGLYVKRREPIIPVIYDVLEEPSVDESGKLVGRVHEYSNYPRDSLFKVKGCGFGCCLTSVSLLKVVWDKFGPAFSPYPWAGEDISFCHRVNQLGYDIYCDSTISCGHVGQMIYTEQLLIER